MGEKNPKRERSEKENVREELLRVFFLTPYGKKKKEYLFECPLIIFSSVSENQINLAQFLKSAPNVTISN